MYIDDSFQLNILFYSAGFGFFAALLYDIFKLIHFPVFKSVKWLFAKDLFYSITTAFLCFVFLLSVNNGKIRIYIIIGIILGYICWFMVLSSIFLRFGTLIFNKIKSVVSIFAAVITLPFRLIFSLFTPITDKTKANIMIFFEKTRNKFKIHLKKK